jgi:hypothetical protein
VLDFEDYAWLEYDLITAIFQNHDVTAFDSQTFAQCGGQGNLAAAGYHQCFAHLIRLLS